MRYLCIVFESKQLFYYLNETKMKKLVVMLAVVFSMSFVACGNKEAATETTAPEEVVEAVEATTIEEAPVDSTVAAPADSTVAAE